MNNLTLTHDQQQALSSLNRVWALVEMIVRTYAEDEEQDSREKLLTSLYMLEDISAECKAAIRESFTGHSSNERLSRIA